jgi:hypothetical protein
VLTRRALLLRSHRRCPLHPTLHVSPVSLVRTPAPLRRGRRGGSAPLHKLAICVARISVRSRSAQGEALLPAFFLPIFHVKSSDRDRTGVTSEGETVAANNNHVMGSSWVPALGGLQDPLMVGVRSPDGLVVGSCTSHPGVLGSIPNERNQGKQGATLC